MLDHGGGCGCEINAIGRTVSSDQGASAILGLKVRNRVVRGYVSVLIPDPKDDDAERLRESARTCQRHHRTTKHTVTFKALSFMTLLTLQ